MFGGLLRRAEQAILQQVGVVSSSYEQDAGFQNDELRLNAADETAKSLSAALSNHLVAQKRVAEANRAYAVALNQALHGSVALAPVIKAIDQHENSVGRPTELYLKEGLGRLGKALRSIASLRTDFSARKDKVLDHDSYVRRVSQAEGALASARDQQTQGEARDALRKAQVKVRDTSATITRMTESIRSRLTSLEADLASAASENALSFLAAQVHINQHAADGVTVLLPSYPGSGVHSVLLAESARRLGSGASVGGGMTLQPHIINGGLLRDEGTPAGSPGTVTAAPRRKSSGPDGRASPVPGAAGAGPAASPTVTAATRMATGAQAPPPLPPLPSGGPYFSDVIRTPLGIALPEGLPGAGLPFDAMHAAALPAGTAAAVASLTRTRSGYGGTAVRGMLRPGLPGPSPQDDSSGVADPGPGAASAAGAAVGVDDDDDEDEGGGSGRNTPAPA